MIRLLVCLICVSLFAEEEYAFYGKHFIATYKECNDEALKDLPRLEQAFEEAVRASGATLLQSSKYIFSPDAITIVSLLSESHASIHTYPEKGACFVDLFTCGDRCAADKFHAVLSAYLKPKQVSSRVLIRHHSIEDACSLKTEQMQEGN